MVKDLLAFILFGLLAGSLAYCVISLIAALRYLGALPPKHGNLPPVSVLKPLAGVDDGLEENLRSFFRQDYPCFEILFAIHTEDDPAGDVVRKLQKEFPGVRSRLLVSGESGCPNRKVNSLQRMRRHAKYGLLVASDSDVYVEKNMLRAIAGELDDVEVGLVTCPYRAVAGRSFWSTLEAIGMNTEFLGGMLTARMLEGMKFALGALVAVKRSVLEELGGFARLQDYLADDFVLGRFVAEAGYRVILSAHTVEHRIGAQSFAVSVSHRLRWNRSTRRSRPLGYCGQVFTNPIALALLLTAVNPVFWPLLILTLVVRIGTACAMADWVVKDPATIRQWYLIPFQDLFSFVTWVAGFFGSAICWRAIKYRVLPDGRLELWHPLDELPRHANPETVELTRSGAGD